MVAVYVQEFTITVYSTAPAPREQIAKELRTMEFTGEPVIAVDVGCGMMAMSLENAVERLVHDDGTRAQVKRLQEMVEAEDLKDVGTEEDEHDNSGYDGPRWTYAADSTDQLIDLPGIIQGSIQSGFPKGSNSRLTSGQTMDRLTEAEERKFGVELVGWPGRIPDDEIDADYRFGGRKQTPDGSTTRTEDALRALIEHAIRTAPDELAGPIKTAWAVYKQRGVDFLGEKTDSLPRLCDIIVFG